MFRFWIRKQAHPGERWRVLGEPPATDLSQPIRLADAEAAESDLLSLRIYPPAGCAPAVRVYVGSVLVASTITQDRVLGIDHDDSSDAEVPPLVCRGRLLADWVGLTELAIDIRPGDDSGWHRALLVSLAVSAGKLETEQFNQLFSELEHDSAAVLLDVHGKTQVGLKSVQRLASSAPVAVLQRLRETIGELDELLHRMARQPAARLRSQLSREQAMVGQAISEATLAEACRDPSLLGRRGQAVVFREVLREHTRPDYRITEHQVIADFNEHLKAQLVDLRQRIDAEIEDRSQRKRWRSVSRDAGSSTWWESEDLPRIEELQRCGLEVARLWKVTDRWGHYPFLPPGKCLTQKPQSTPLFHNHAVYRRVFRVIAGHFTAYEATLDTHKLLTQARSLPVLYEWWCAVRVIRILSGGLMPLLHDPLSRPIISTRLEQQGQRFTIEFSADQAINFHDSQGARVRYRYQPEYLACRGASGPAVGALDAASVRTPDMALEVFPADSASRDVPALIIVLDAKYSSASQWDKMTEVTTKYSKIGDGKTGRVLSRQVWALTPAAPANGGKGEELPGYCTVDNEAFWSEHFDVNNPVNGAVMTRPVRPGEFDPLQELLASLLKRAGVVFAGETQPPLAPPPAAG